MHAVMVPPFHPVTPQDIANPIPNASIGAPMTVPKIINAKKRPILQINSQSTKKMRFVPKNLMIMLKIGLEGHINSAPSKSATVRGFAVISDA
jgi:hypothetical protein